MLCRQSHTRLARKCGILLCRSRVVLYFWGGQCTIAGVSLCPVQFSVEGHQFRVIASDGGDIKPILAGNTNQHNYKIAKKNLMDSVSENTYFFKESLHFTRQCRKFSFLGGNLKLVNLFIIHNKTNIYCWFSHIYSPSFSWYSHVFLMLIRQSHHPQ